MPVETPSLFAQVIQEHLELKQRNAQLEPAMPIESYKAEDPFENHPLFKTEEQARVEETMGDGELMAPEFAAVAAEPAQWPVADEPVAFAVDGSGGVETADTVAHAAVEVDEQSSEDESLWSRSRDFDWGD